MSGRADVSFDRLADVHVSHLLSRRYSFPADSRRIQLILDGDPCAVRLIGDVDEVRAFHTRLGDQITDAEAELDRLDAAAGGPS